MDGQLCAAKGRRSGPPAETAVGSCAHGEPWHVPSERPDEDTREGASGFQMWVSLGHSHGRAGRATVAGQGHSLPLGYLAVWGDVPSLFCGGVVAARKHLKAFKVHDTWPHGGLPTGEGTRSNISTLMPLTARRLMGKLVSQGQSSTRSLF